MGSNEIAVEFAQPGCHVAQQGLEQLGSWWDAVVDEAAAAADDFVRLDSNETAVFVAVLWAVSLPDLDS